MTQLPSQDSSFARDSTIDDLVTFVVENQPLCVITGAGCSTESGIFDYRGTDGQWKRPPPVHLDEFLRSKAARQRYWARSMLGWPRFYAARPNVAHKSLAHLEARGFIQTVVTQNVDDLHEKAGHKVVIPLHGTLATVTCLACGQRVFRQSIQEWLATENTRFVQAAVPADAGGEATYSVEIDESFNVPSCSSCGGVLKPDVVFFGDNVASKVKAAAQHAVEIASGLLVIGSSLMVYSSFRLVKEAVRRSQPVAILGRGVTRGDEHANLRIHAEIGQTIDLLTKKLLN